MDLSLLADHNWLWGDPRFQQATPLGIVAYLVVTAVSLAASYFLAQQASKRGKGGDLLPDFEASNVATQGAQVPWLFGKLRVGAVVAYVSKPQTLSIPVGRHSTRGGKAATVYAVHSLVGKFENKRTTTFQTMFASSAWHLLCIGPASGLTTIWENGKIIWQGDINPDNTPSGSTVQTDTKGPFIISWGEDDQPVVPEIAAATGVASAYPRVCSIFWLTYITGQTTRWPQVEYELNGLPSGSSAPCSDGLTVTGSHYGPIFSNDDAPLEVNDEGPNSYTGTLESDEFEVVTDGLWWDFTPNNPTDIDEGGPEVLDGYRNRIALNLNGSGDPTIMINSIRVYLSNGTPADDILLLHETGVGPLTWDDDTGPVTAGCWVAEDETWSDEDLFAQKWVRVLEHPYVQVPAGFWRYKIDFDVTVGDAIFTLWAFVGAQAFVADPVVTQASVNWLHRLLFSSFPTGLNLSTDDIDEDSVNAVITALEDEGYEFKVFIQNGTEAASAVNDFLQDCGVLMAWNQTTGKYEFRLIRQDTQAYTLPEGAIESKLPEIETYHGERRTSRMLFSFPDKTRAYRSTVIGIDSDGRAKQLEIVQARKVSIETTTDFATAAMVAERRSQEEMGNPSAITIQAMRGAKRVRVGDLIKLPASFELPAALRVLEVAWKGNANETELKAVVDNYAIEVSASEHSGNGGGSGSPHPAPVEDLAVAFWEVPEELVDPLYGITVAVARIRANADIISADIYLSLDGVNYGNRATTQFDQTGGTLTEGIAAGDPWVIDQGPQFTALGPDIGNTEDLTADPLLWQRGRQCVLIDEELFFCEKVTAIGGSTYRLDGLIRARCDTERAVHSIGATIFIFPLGNLTDVNDGILTPNALIYLKAQPWTTSGFNLADLTPVSKTLVGKGLVPGKPSAFRVTSPTPGSASYRTGDDVEFAWGYRSSIVPNQGAGQVPVGTPYGVSPVRGDFELKFFTLADVLKDTIRSSVPALTYTNVDLVAAFGTEQSFKVELRNINGGLRSPPVLMTVVLL